MISNNKSSCKSGGVCFLNSIFNLNLPKEFHWDILFQSKVGNNIKTLSQITPLLSFFSPDEWRECCNKDDNNRKGSLCHYKPKQHKLKKEFFHSRMIIPLESTQ